MTGAEDEPVAVPVRSEALPARRCKECGVPLPDDADVRRAYCGKPCRSRAADRNRSVAAASLRAARSDVLGRLVGVVQALAGAVAVALEVDGVTVRVAAPA